MLYSLIKDITKLLYDESVDKKFDKYDDLVELTFYLFDYVKEDLSNYNKVVIKSIVEMVVEMNKVSIPDKVELRDRLRELDELLVIKPVDLDELVKCLMIPKIDRTYVVDNTLYTSSYYLFKDFKDIVVKRSSVAKKYRAKVYAYMYYLSNLLLTKIEEYNIEINEDNKDLVWIFRTILKTDEFRKSYETLFNPEIIENNKSKALYYGFTFSI